MHLEDSEIEPIITLLLQYQTELFAIENHTYLRLINTVCKKPKKLDILRTLFTVAAADRSINADEDRSMDLIAQGLKLTHREFVKVRAEFSQHRDVFKR